MQTEIDEAAEMELLEEMASFRKGVTGVENTIFISPKGRVQHAARIMIAIDPPQSIDPHSETATVAIDDGAVVEGEVPPALLWRVQQFIEINRAVLLEYWEYRISTDELQRRLKSV